MGKEGGAGDGGWMYLRERREEDMCKGEEGYVWVGGEGMGWVGMG